jgi:hypothetical protein
MILMTFLAMILLYFVHRVTEPKDKDIWSEYLLAILAGFGILFLFIDLIDKIKGLF